MGDPDAPFVDGERLGDLTRVGDNSVTRQPHIFLAAGGPEVERSSCKAGSMGGNDEALSLAIHSTTPASDVSERVSAAASATARSFSPKSRDPRMSSG